MTQTVQQQKAEAARLEKRLKEVTLQIEKLTKERIETRQRLEQIRVQLTVCPKCGHDKGFLADEGGFFVRVLEDPDDVDLLTPGKALYCPSCSEVFLFSGKPPAAAATKFEPKPIRRRK